VLHCKTQAENRVPDRHLTGERDPDFTLLGRSKKTMKAICRPLSVKSKGGLCIELLHQANERGDISLRRLANG